MDMQSCVRCFVQSINSYRKNATTVTIIDVIQKLEILDSIGQNKDSLVLFDFQDIYSIQALSFLVTQIDISNLSDNVAKDCALSSTTNLLQKSISLLNTLVINQSVRKTLIHKFDLIPQVSLFYVKQYTITDDLSISMKCLDLLRGLTYAEEIREIKNYHMDLIKFLIRNSITSNDNQLITLSLENLTNLTRKNDIVQRYIKSLVSPEDMTSLENSAFVNPGLKEEVTQFYRFLTESLRKSDSHIIVFSLCLLTCLCQYEKVGEMLYSSKNTIQTIQYIMTLIIKPELQYRKIYVIDLFVDILECNSIQRALSRYTNLKSLLTHIISLLMTPTNVALNSCPETHTKVLELLCKLFSIHSIRETLFSAILSPVHKDKKVKTTADNSFKRSMSCHFDAVLHWSQAPVDHLNRRSPSPYALALLIRIFECSIDINYDMADKVEEVNESLLSIIESHVTNKDQDDVPCSQLRSTQYTERIYLAIKVLSYMSRHSFIDARISKSVGEHCMELVEHEFNHNAFSISDDKFTIEESSYDGANIVLYSLEFLLLNLRKDDKTLLSNLHKYLQDVRVIGFLTYGLSSTDADLLNATLAVNHYGYSLDDFPKTLFLKSVLQRNENNPKYVHNNNTSTDSMQCNTAEFSESGSRDIADLVERLKGSQVEETKSSEIIQLYENLLSQKTAKESSLKVALQHSEQVATELRCRIANSESLCFNTRTILRTAEERYERCDDQLTDCQNKSKDLSTRLEDMTNKYEDSINKYDDLLEKNKKLESEFDKQKFSLTDTKRSLDTMTSEVGDYSKMMKLIQNLSKEKK